MDIPCPPGETRPGCAAHPSAPAVARCVRCGRLTCSLCRVVHGNRNFCRSCAAAGAAIAPGAAGGGPPPPQAAWGYGAYGPPQQPAPQGYYPGYQYPPPPIPYRQPHEIVFPGAPWGVGEAVLIFIISVVLASAVTFLVALLLRNSFTPTSAIFVIIFISSVVLYAFLLTGTFYSVKVRHRSTLAAIGLKQDGFGHGVALGFIIGLPVFVGAILVAYVIQKLVNPTTTDQLSKSVNTISSGTVSWSLIALLALTLVILAPVCEEIFFRGYLYPALRNRMSKQPAMILNGLLFAAAHFEIIGFLPRFLLGWGLCYIYERNKTLGGPMTGHALYNGIVLLLAGVFRVF
ncbi:MAG: B-box zinc finger protein [Candidatus Geothermincolia bacterium]